MPGQAFDCPGDESPAVTELSTSAESSLLLVLARELVGVPQHDPPLPALLAVSLRAAQCPGPRAIADVPGHVLQVDGEGKVIVDDCYHVLRPATSGCNALRGPVEALTCSQPRS
jgi:hypothetical protein